MLNKSISLYLFVGLFSLFAGCRGAYTDVSGDPDYKKFNSVIGKEFKTKVPLYVVKSGPSVPYIRVSTRRDLGIPGIDNVTIFPYRAGPMEVYGILSAGSIYRVTNTVQRNSSTMGSTFWLAAVTSSGPFQGWTIRTDEVVNPELNGPNYKYENVEEVREPAR